MATSYLQRPFGISVQSHGNCRVFTQKGEPSSFSYQPASEFPRINMCPSATCNLKSKGCVGRIRGLSNNSDFFWEEISTPILDMVENPVNMKNLSTKVEIHGAESISQ